MFDFVEKHKRLMMFMLVLVIAPAFVLVGVQTFDQGVGNANIAEVEGQPIALNQFEQALDEQRERARQALGRNFDASTFDTPERRKELLDQLIAQRLLLDYASKHRMVISNAQLQEAVKRYPEFLDEQGNISKEKFEVMVRAAGMTPEGFFAGLRTQMVGQQVTGAIEQAAFVSQSSAEHFALLSGESREVSRFVLPVLQYASQVQITPAEIESYYSAHTDEFRTPEQVRAAYVVLSREAVESQISVNAEEVKKQYEASVGPKLKAREEARAKAEPVLAELRKNPGRFAELAKQHSQDTASAGQGGDVGYFGRGAMVKAFEDAVFKLKPQEISPIVETEFGFHIIQLTDIKGAERRASHILWNAPSLPKDQSASMAGVEKEIRQQALVKKVAEATENFKDVAYEQPESLQPLAERFKLNVQTSNWVSKSAGQPPLDHPRLLNALFAPETVQEKHNTEAVELVPGRRLVARVLEHRSASVRPLSDVRSDIERTLREQKAMVLAKQSGEEKLKALQAGESVAANWSIPIKLSRDKQTEVGRDVLSTLF
ncbi:MAG TPA: SurA N-terminal domain-containing protein, partial [Burkholderiales bacterium]|nr:SurA N-terminal domain-containing protein [Burkholderiales bacterium]